MAMASRRGINLFIGNMSWTTSRYELQDYFSQFGRIVASRVIFDPETGISRGFGFVSMSNKDEVKAVLSQPNHTLDGSKLNVRLDNTAAASD